MMTLEPVPEVSVEVSTEHPRELRTRDELCELLAAHDLSGLQRTDQVVVENRATPYSHPTLTLNTRTTGDQLLSTFVHEQLHGWLKRTRAWIPPADATRSAWPTVPDAAHGGAQDERSTRGHLILCHL